MSNRDSKADQRASLKKPVRNNLKLSRFDVELTQIPLQRQTASSSRISAPVCRHFGVNDYDRIIVSTLNCTSSLMIFLTQRLFQHGFPPIVRKTQPLEKICTSHTHFPPIKCPPLSQPSPKTSTVAQKESTTSLDIQSLIENKVRKLKNNAFLYLKYAVPATSEHFTPYNLM